MTTLPKTGTPRIAQEPGGASGDSRQWRTPISGIYACYFLSGSLGLIYQILWLRKLLLVFGSTVHAVSTVLTVFFGGLALGSWLFGRLIDRQESAGLRWYAALEIGIGAYAFLTLPLFDAIRAIYIPLYRASGFSPVVLVAASFACSSLILLLPTALMGGTFPMLSRFLIRSSEERGTKIAALYGINTAGAMVGTLLVYYAGLPVLGLTRTIWCAGVLNLGIGILCLLFDRELVSFGFHALIRRNAEADGKDRATQVDRTDTIEENSHALRWLLIAFSFSGFSAMVYEVAWTRALSLVLGSSTYAFCIMLATFLCGIAMGSFVGREHLREAEGTPRQFVKLETLLVLYGILSVALFSHLPEWFIALWPLLGQSFLTVSWLQVTLSSMAMIIPTIIMGLLFPLVSDIVTRRFAQLGHRLGSAYAINTLGGIIGSFLSGFILIPLLGLPLTIIVAATVNLLAATLVFIGLEERRARRIGRAVLATTGVVGALLFGLSIALPLWKQQIFAAGVYLRPDAYQNVSTQDIIKGSKLLYYRDSLNATVSVHQADHTIYLKVGGKTDASNGIDMGTQVLSAHIPLLLHQDPKSVLVIGLGSGVTLGSAGRHAVSTLHCAEIDPAVIEGARYFRAYNYNIHDDPRTTIFAADGRNFLLASPRQYDVLISEPSNPWMSGLAYLFTKEFYELARQRLAPHGIMCQWLQLYGIFPADLKLMLKTFHEVFPYVSVWSPIPGDFLLIGSMEPQRLDVSRLKERMSAPKVRDSLHRISVDRPDTFLQLFWMGNREVEQLTADTIGLHQDDQPWVEFDAPKSLYVNRTFSVNYGGLTKFKGSPQAIASDYVQPEDAAFYQSLAMLWSSRDEYAKEREALEKAVALDSSSVETWRQLEKVCLKLQNPLAAEHALKRITELAPSDVEAYHQLGRLHWQQGDLEGAWQSYLSAARIRVPDSELVQELGNYLSQRHQSMEAAECYRSSLSQEGGNRLTLLLSYADTLKTLHAWNEAERVIRFGMSAFPSEVAFPLALGQILGEQGRWSEAEPFLRHVIDLVPKSIEGYYQLGRAMVAQERPAEAVKYLMRVTQYNPYHREALTLLQQITANSSR